MENKKANKQILTNILNCTIFILILVLSGCRDVTDIRDERGKSQRRTFHYGKAVVFKAAKESLISLGFAIAEINESEGYLSGEKPSEGALGFKSGEIIGIWISGEGNFTQVEIAWLRRSALDPVAQKDWPIKIFNTIDEKLSSTYQK